MLPLPNASFWLCHLKCSTGFKYMCNSCPWYILHVWYRLPEHSRFHKLHSMSSRLWVSEPIRPRQQCSMCWGLLLRGGCIYVFHMSCWQKVSLHRVSLILHLTACHCLHYAQITFYSVEWYDDFIILAFHNILIADRMCQWTSFQFIKNAGYMGYKCTLAGVNDLDLGVIVWPWS